MTDSLTRKRAPLLLVTLTVTLVLSGCGTLGGDGMNREEAREQLTTAVEAVQSATGEAWEVEVEPGILGCSRTHEQWTTSWNATPTTDRDVSYKSVRKALEEAGFETSLLGPKSRTPMVGAQTPGGFGLYFSIPVEGGPAGLSVGSDCFPVEE